MADLLGDVAKVLDLWLQAPVPLIFGKQRVLVEEAVEIVSMTVATLLPTAGTVLPRIESAHGVVALESTVHDSSVALLRDALLGDFGIDPLREAPHLGANLAELYGSRGVVLDGVLECLVEVAIVQEDIGVMVPAVEVALDRLDGLNYTIKLLVSCQNNKRTIGTRLAGVGFETAFDEDFVVLFADFSAWEERRSVSGQV